MMEPTIRKIYFRIFILQQALEQIEKERKFPLSAESADIIIASRDTNIQCKTEELAFLNEIISNLVKH